jgi:hypothetical protein
MTLVVGGVYVVIPLFKDVGHQYGFHPSYPGPLLAAALRNSRVVVTAMYALLRKEAGTWTHYHP